MEDVCTWWHFKLYACSIRSFTIIIKYSILEHINFLNLCCSLEYINIKNISASFCTGEIGGSGGRAGRRELEKRCSDGVGGSGRGYVGPALSLTKMSTSPSSRERYAFHFKYYGQ
ncbi:uncharacterized protein [Lolium perenne]|uniref:uncharacterized protein n=1 Tax=Lolium perenne TaxID=4522 RepID=UPI003A9A1C1C